MRKLLLSIVLASSLLVSGLMPAVASAALADNAKNSVCQGVNLSDTNSTCDQDAGNKVQSVVSKALNLFSVIIGIIAIVMMMIAGVKYVASQGDATQVNNAKNTIIYAAVGLVVAAMAQIIVRFVLAKFKN